MAEQLPDQKQYFVDTDWAFERISTWLTNQRKKRSLHDTACQTVQLPFISGNGRDEHQTEWSRHHDFSRIAHSTLRLMMLKATGLIDLLDPAISEPARKRNVGNL